MIQFVWKLNFSFRRGYLNILNLQSTLVTISGVTELLGTLPMWLDYNSSKMTGWKWGQFFEPGSKTQTTQD